MRAAPSEYVHLARQLVARVTVFEPVELQAVAAARELSQLEPERAAFVLGALIGLAREGAARERITLDAVGRAILNAPPEQLSRLHRRRILEAAVEAELTEVAALFIAPKPVLSVDDRAPGRGDPSIAHLTLGHKKMLARSANPDLLARLAAEAEPSVIRNILLNPKLTEPLVVRICARRPVRAEVLRAVYESRRWTHREKVREAIVQNPYCEPELALKLLPNLSQAVIREVARNATLHLSLREAAQKLLARTEPERTEH